MAIIIGEVTTGDLQELFDISGPGLHELVRRGFAVKTGRGRFDGDASVRKYIKHLRGVASGRGGEKGTLDLTAERAKLAKEQAEGHAMKNALARGEMVMVAEVERTWTGVLSVIRSKILAVTSRVRHRLPHLTAHDADVIDRELRDALTETAQDGGE